MTTKTDERSAVVRVNQVGYPADAPKVAFAMLPAKVASVRFEVVTPYGVAYRGTSADDLGSWNTGYRAVYQLSFSGVRTPGQYQVKLLSPASAVSPMFTIGDGTQLYRPLVNNAVQYFTSERDGPDVDSAVLIGNFAPFKTKTAAYEDNVVSWPSVEPADDYTANSLLAFALSGEIGSGLG